MQLNVRQRIVVFAARLQRCVRRPVRKVEKKWSVFVRFDHSNRLVGVVIGQIFGGFKVWPTVKAGSKSQRRPKKAVDWIKILARLNDLVIVATPVERTRHQQTFVKPLIVGCHAVIAAEVPLTNVHRVITLLAQQFGQGDF